LNYFLINTFIAILYLIISIGKEYKEKDIIYYFFGVLFILLIGLRGNDDEYSRLFTITPYLSSFFSDMSVALGNGIIFALITSTLKSLGLNSQSLLFFFAFFSICIRLKYYKIFSEYYLIAFLFYLSHEVIFHEWIQIRAGLASAMVLPMMYYLQIDNKKKFMILYIVSSLIHYVSVISIILLWIDRPLKIKWLFMGLFISLLIYQFKITGFLFNLFDNYGLLPPLVKLYLNYELYTYPASLFHPKTFQQIATSFLLLFILNGRRYYSKNINHGIINIYILSTMFQIAFNDFGIFAFRTAGHFYVVEPLIITYLISFFKEKKLVISTCVIFCIFLSHLNYVKLDRLDPYDLFVNPSSLKW